MSTPIEALAQEYGRKEANPVIRSMYPSMSRGQMAEKFAEAFKAGAKAASGQGETRIRELEAKLAFADKLAAQALENALEDPKIQKELHEIADEYFKKQQEELMKPRTMQPVSHCSCCQRY